MRTRRFAFGVLLWTALQLNFAHADEADHRSAADYCRRFPSISLSEDHGIACFNGPILKNQDLSAFHWLKQGGIFVMRSPGGYAREAMTLANILREKAASVVVYDYCLSACANYVLVATDKTYVMKDTVVAWHGGPSVTEYFCDSSVRERLLREYPDRYRAGDLDTACQTRALIRTFFKDRQLNSRHIYEPQSYYTKKMVSLARKETEDPRSVFWMWNPVNYGDYFKSRITFEAYPQNQSEVNEILSRFWRSKYGNRFIFDP